jgi:hypothetical protein
MLIGAFYRTINGDRLDLLSHHMSPFCWACPLKAKWVRLACEVLVSHSNRGLLWEVDEKRKTIVSCSYPLA